MSQDSRCGYVGIIGCPNVGKSTLLNHLLGRKISITSRKRQTTRHRILGIKTQGDTQIVYVDTPGLHQEAKKSLNRYMNRIATSGIYGVDIIVFMITALKWTTEDEWVLKKIQRMTCPVILVINKVDKIDNKVALLPFIEELSKKYDFTAIVPISALKNDNVARLEQSIDAHLPLNPHFFPGDQVTDATDRLMAAEMIREKLTRSLGQELPYALAVQIEQFVDQGSIIRISAMVWVEKPGQKAIVIGQGGAVLKKIGTAARKEMESFFAKKVFLQLWVKVKENWSDNDRILRSLGYEDEK